MAQQNKNQIPALVVKQWLPDWDKIQFDEEQLRRRPDPYFFVFSIRATWLRQLSEIYRRQAVGRRSKDKASQRKHTPERSIEISKFIRGGFPWSDLSDRQKASDDFSDLQMPGWLSTAIIANILAPGTQRLRTIIDDEDVISIELNKNGTATLTLPDRFEERDWDDRVKPLEIIDGQHRLLAFDDIDLVDPGYELPIVAFYDLDIAWQAYLFYTINIKPKRINQSLGYDLYPLLRTQDWLERSPERAFVYRETRAQELVEILWSYPKSPWASRINMLGDPGSGTVTQAAFIRALTNSFVKRWDGTRLGGLFGAEFVRGHSDVLQWGRLQQAAFLIFIWQRIAAAIDDVEPEWAIALANPSDEPLTQVQISELNLIDPAFSSKSSLLASDQGIRGILQIFNDMVYSRADFLDLNSWEWLDDLDEEGIANADLEEAIISLCEQEKILQFVAEIAEEIVHFEWRNSSALADREASVKQMIYRGSGGYKQLRIELLKILVGSDDETVRDAAMDVVDKLAYGEFIYQ